MGLDEYAWGCMRKGPKVISPTDIVCWNMVVLKQEMDTKVMNRIDQKQPYLLECTRSFFE